MSHVEGAAWVDVHPDKPWVGALVALAAFCPSDRPMHFRGWMPVHTIYDGQMYRWEVRWSMKEPA